DRLQTMMQFILAEFSLDIGCPGDRSFLINLEKTVTKDVCFSGNGSSTRLGDDEKLQSKIPKFDRPGVIMIPQMRVMLVHSGNVARSEPETFKLYCCFTKSVYPENLLLTR
ncbi:11390_t:CDS:2, partial [Acaulospora morrowiae]